MEISYTLFVYILTFSLLIGTLSYIGFIVRIIYLWKSYSELQKSDSSAHIVFLSVLFAFSAFVSLGMVLPTLNYPH
jgi:hypothetical protein